MSAYGNRSPRIQSTNPCYRLCQEGAELDTYHRPSARSMLPERIRVSVLEPADSEALLAMVGRCSPTARYHRFHGVTSGVSYAEQVLAAADCQDSFAAWIGKECVGLGNLHICDDTAEIGVLVEDDRQRRGVGTALLIALVRRVRERGSHFLRAEVLDENHFALQVLGRLGPAKTSLAYGSYTTLVDLAHETTHFNLSTVPAEPHRAQLLRDAECYRRARGAKAGSRRPRKLAKELCLAALSNKGENGHWDPFSRAS
jgi:GNAT superfamily N-acetyltransferase